MSENTLTKGIATMSDRCHFDPRSLSGYPLGQFHCPLCGEMVLAGMDHPQKWDHEMEENLVNYWRVKWAEGHKDVSFEDFLNGSDETGGDLPF